ncbi:MAG: PAS domain S-box protein, partial [Anaerolineae bacterium]|nr:PAS domain S-box protein [Anaerolineae bacterium]
MHPFRSKRLADVLRRLLVARLILPVLASVALVELLAGVLVWRTVSTRQETMIGGLANRITLVLEETQQDVQAVARLGAEPEQLTFLLAAAPQIERIYRSDAQGRLLAMQPPNDAYLDFDLSNQPFSTLPLAEQSAVFGGPYTSPLSGKQTLFLAAPLPDGGRLVADIGLEFLEQQMQASMAVEQGNASVAYYNAQGQQVVANRAVFAPVPESGPAVSIRDTTFWLTSRKAAGPQGWNVVVQSPMMQQGFLLVAAALALFIVPLIALLFMLRYSRSLERAIANPLRLLNERTRQLAGGDYTRWISFATVSASFNEVAELADSFERMQHAIQQRQAALQVSEARFREMAELLPDMMVELDAARRIRYANRAALNRVLHCENGQLFDRTLAADDTHALQMLCRQAAGSDGNHPVVLRFLRPEGGTFPGELALTASRGADGSLLGYRGVVRDITERLSFEESLRRSYRLFTEGPVVMFRVNAAGDQPVEYVSPNVTQFGCRPYDFKTRDDYVERLVHPVDRARMRAERAARQDSDAAFFEAEYRIVSVDGAMRWVYDFTSVSRAPDGSPGHYDWYILDITERKRAEERIGKQLQRMAALQLVDSSITANADLSLTLHLLVTQLIELLEINAAVVLRYEAQS